MKINNIRIITSKTSYGYEPCNCVVNGVACLKFEPSFLLEPILVDVIWRSSEKIISTDLFSISRDTVAVFLPVPNVASKITLEIKNDESLITEIHIKQTKSDFSFLRAKDFSRYCQSDYDLLREALISLGFHELCNTVRKKLESTSTKIILVCGSVGKTTSKEFISHCFRNSNVPIYHSTDSWNFPHEILAQAYINCENSDVMIFEAAVNGQLAELSTALEPFLIVFTPVGAVHTGSYGNVENIINAKAKVAAGLKNDGYIVAPMNSHKLIESIENVLSENEKSHDIICFPRDNDMLSQFDNKKIRSLHPEAAKICAEALYKFGFNQSEVLQNIRTFPPVPHRLELLEFKDNVLLSDSYNANPISMKRFCDAIKSHSPSESDSGILVGEMLDLDLETSLSAHEFIMDKIVNLASYVLLVGENFATFSNNMPNHVVHVNSIDQISTDHLNKLISYRFIAVKGSFSSGVHLVDKKIRRVLEMNG